MPWSPDDQPVNSCWSRSRGSAALELLSALISVMEQNAGEQGSSVTHGLLQHHKNQYVSFLSLSSSVYIAGLLGNPLFFKLQSGWSSHNISWSCAQLKDERTIWWTWTRLKRRPHREWWTMRLTMNISFLKIDDKTTEKPTAKQNPSKFTGPLIIFYKLVDR